MKTLEILHVAYIWDKCSVKSRALWTVLDNLPFGLLTVMDKPWAELPEYYRNELVKSWSGREGRNEINHLD